MAKKNKILVLCVDRDNDLGEKTGIKGPVIGREKNVEAATKLILADPADADANTIFEAVRTYDELKKERGAEVATITGHRKVGLGSDEEINRQLDSVLKKVSTKDVILVSDGIDDERIIPLIQNKVKLVSINRLVIKQSERLEGMYYMVHDFIENPKMSKVVLGVPAIFFILYAIFGFNGWRVVLGLLGAYLLVKGFKLEELVGNFANEFKTALVEKRVSFFFYIAAIAVSLIGVKSGYDLVKITPFKDILEQLAVFMKGSIYILFLSYLITIAGKIISLKPKKKEVFKYVTLVSLGFSLTLVTAEAANIILVPETDMLGLFAYIIFGFLLVLVSAVIERKMT